MIPAVPVLGSEGWVTDGDRMMRQLYALIFSADQAQDPIYKDAVTSMGYLIQMYGSDSSAFQSNVTTALKGMFGRYFDNVSVSFTEANDQSAGGPTGYDLEIIGWLSGKRHTLRDSISNAPLTVKKRFVT